MHNTLISPSIFLVFKGGAATYYRQHIEALRAAAHQAASAA